MKSYSMFFISILLFFLNGCSKKDVVVEDPVIVGKIEKAMLNNPQFPWFERNYQSYLLKKDNQPILDQIRDKKTGFSVIVFMGTWCGDSKRELPRFYKIMEETNFLNFELYGLDKKKKSPDGKELAYKIEKVPTFIFFKNGKEIGRIIEMPEKTLEEDILSILKKE